MKNIAILMGGIGSEREVSLNTGKNVFESLLKSEKYNPIPIDLNKNREWVLLDSSLKPTSKVKISDGKIITEKGEVEAVFIALHGKGGEDGAIQGFLETLGVPYTGSGVLASSLGMDKTAFKNILKCNGIPQATFTAIKINQKDKKLEELIKNFQKCVVKPNAEGSSVGVSIVKKSADLEKAINNAFKHGNEIIVEEYIKGREFSCGILGNDVLEVLPPIEIKPKNEFFDYEAKYTDGLCEEICPANLTREEEKKIKKISVDTYKAIGCKGVARVDVFLKNNGEVLVIEINTVPGLTSNSLLPKEAKAAGLSFRELIEKIIGHSL